MRSLVIAEIAKVAPLVFAQDAGAMRDTLPAEWSRPFEREQERLWDSSLLPGPTRSTIRAGETLTEVQTTALLRLLPTLSDEKVLAVYSRLMDAHGYHTYH